MTHGELDEILARTLDDGRLSRSERKALRAILEDLAPGRRGIEKIRKRVFAAAADALPDPRSQPVLGWVEDVTRILLGLLEPPDRSSTMEVLFSPTHDCARRIASLFAATRESADVCVYTITHDRISRAAEDAHNRGVAVRVITDDEKTADAGSDVTRLTRAGVPVAVDDSPHQMHHKFAVFDRSVVITGSYNWTRSAAEHNQENLVISDDSRLLRAYGEEFETLWKRFRATS